MKKSIAIATLAVAGLVSAMPASAADEHNTAPGLTAEGAPLGLHGFDPVAFLEIENRTEGTATYTGIHDGVAYYFASEENLEKFEDNPQRYVPENGGFCTFGVSVGKKFDGDPNYAAVVDGKLYVFLNEQIYKMFQEDKQGVIATAAENWKEIEHVAATEL